MTSGAINRQFEGVMNKNQLSFKIKPNRSFVNTHHRVFRASMPHLLLHPGGAIKPITLTCLFWEPLMPDSPPSLIPEGRVLPTFISA